jgi:uncharacterized protein DUF3306
VSEPEGSEGFLSRWARRKRESGEAARADRAPDETSSEQTSAQPPARSDMEMPPLTPEPPSVDLSALPAIESITSATDIRPFLAPGVPAELTRAALRRAWVADPQIRDFIGIAENQWDFNDPEGIPGFGALGPLDVRRLVANMLGGSEEAAAAPSPAKSDELSTPDAPAAALGATSGDMSAREAPRETQPVSEVTHGESDGVTLATQNEDDPSSPSAAPPRRGHGGALPR